MEGRIVKVKVERKGQSPHSNQGVRGKGYRYDYKHKANIHDYKQMALLLIDLENYGANLDKIFKEIKKQKKEVIDTFPFG
jgi:hypothetical protein